MWVYARTAIVLLAIGAPLAGCGTSHVEVIERSESATTVSVPAASNSENAPPETSASMVTNPPPSSSDGVDAGLVSSVVPSADAAVDLDAGPPDSCLESGAFAVARYRLRLRSNGNCLGAGAATMSEGKNALSTVVAADCGNDPLWQLIAVSGGFFEVRNVTLGLSLESFNGIASLGTDIVMMLPENEPAQQFGLLPMGGPYYEFSLRAYPSRCMTQSFTGKAELADCDPSDPTQHWEMEDFSCRQLDELDAGL